MKATEKGKVKFFNEEKGFGFIVQEGTGKEVFVHKSGARERLYENDNVEFVIERSEKGLFASNVEVI